jgi:ribosome-binding protein aMBF1 (putative translation factor)
MSMRAVCVCDLCGKESKAVYKLVGHEMPVYTEGSEMRADLCSDCKDRYIRPLLRALEKASVGA